MRREVARPHGIALLPASPGVYVMRDARGKVLYIGRSANLRARVRSYWGPLGERYHLSRMISRVAWVEPFVTASEHEAAFVERQLLTKFLPPYNRALGGQETIVWLRLAEGPTIPGLALVHDSDGVASSDFGPYLGGSAVRRAVQALLWLYPLQLTAEPGDGSIAALGRARGVAPADRLRLAETLRSILRRQPGPVKRALDTLARLRDEAAGVLDFETAAERQAQVEAIDWLTQPQLVASMSGGDREVVALGCEGNHAVRVVVEVRGGSFYDREAVVVAPGSRPGAPSPRDGWERRAQANADLLARMLSAGAIGAGLGRLIPAPRAQVTV